MTPHTVWDGIWRRLRRVSRHTKKWFLRRPDYIRHYLKSVREFSGGRFDDLAASPPAAKRLIVARIGPRRGLPWTWELPRREEIDAQADAVYAAISVWPLSYAYPGPPPQRGKRPEELLSPLFPGHRYGFRNEQEYQENYRRYGFAMTHKKAGWDCFRHVEILHAGGIPFMPDARAIPAGTMVHYPKHFFEEVVSRLFESADIPPLELFHDLRQYVDSYLTTWAMARYMMARVGMTPGARVLFLDPAAGAKPDYTSNLTLIGLKQVLGDAVEVSHPTPYLYADWEGKATRLYGRGFGYSRVLDPLVRTAHEEMLTPLSLDHISPEEWDWVVVGSVVRNPALTAEIRTMFPAERTILLHGEDTPPTPAEVADLAATGAHVFVREISNEAYVPQVSRA